MKYIATIDNNDKALCMLIRDSMQNKSLSKKKPSVLLQLATVCIKTVS